MLTEVPYRASYQIQPVEIRRLRSDGTATDANTNARSTASSTTNDSPVARIVDFGLRLRLSGQNKRLIK